MQLKYEQSMQARKEQRRKILSSEMTKNIKVSDNVHRELGNLGKLSESYNDVIQRLIDHYKKTAGGREQHG